MLQGIVIDRSRRHSYIIVVFYVSKNFPAMIKYFSKLLMTSFSSRHIPILTPNLSADKFHIAQTKQHKSLRVTASSE